jgi:hypothetical protein
VGYGNDSHRKEQAKILGLFFLSTKKQKTESNYSLLEAFKKIFIWGHKPCKNTGPFMQ